MLQENSHAISYNCLRSGKSKASDTCMPYAMVEDDLDSHGFSALHRRTLQAARNRKGCGRVCLKDVRHRAPTWKGSSRSRACFVGVEGLEMMSASPAHHQLELDSAPHSGRNPFSALEEGLKT